MSDPYGRGSRYRRIPAVTRTDHTGRTREADAIRDRPVTPGTFVHTVSDGDRLDHLAHRYYGAPHKWWAIADANPDIASPLALLGLDPITRARLIGEVDAADVAALRSLAGVEDVALDEATTPPSLLVTYNRATVTAQVLAETANVDHAVETSRAGATVVVPPEPTS